MTQPTAVPGSRTPFWEDLLEIFYAPAAVFERRKTSGFGLALVVLVLAGTVLFLVVRSAMEPIFDAEFRRGFAAAMRANPQLTEEMLPRARQQAWTFSAVFAPFLFLVAPLFSGFVLWLAGKLVDARQELGAAMMVGTYAYYPRLLEVAANALQTLVLPDADLNGRYRVSLGAGRFLDPDTVSPLLVAVVGRIDVFTLWVTALLAIGLSVTGKVARRDAAMAAAVVWLAGALPGILGALRAG